jgi:hypothetical protein
MTYKLPFPHIRKSVARLLHVSSNSHWFLPGKGQARDGHGFRLPSTVVASLVFYEESLGGRSACTGSPCQAKSLGLRPRFC